MNALRNYLYDTAGSRLQVGIGVSCSADRQALGKITKDGVFLEQLETNPAKYLPEVTDEHLSDDVVKIDLNKPMDEIRKYIRRQGWGHILLIARLERMS